ncbi:uncharacterized protein CC84DRAFT_165842 [Paraphaeosphaeria sporulosa]|uniref:Uncharacterized protein n=1 Tax=Paraphaeosphaeria sporulosa TaxID=1460663 RepID=A0A177D176_9PLEO|nr:uncharacterized protein CC84DRAFT_165842 [Paraphaeosphaeria sporulosa]OAG12922.1 hypothetical protein CC84DRAFT_165842 [Paraphaeosphaeria sporulosa]
MLASCLLAVPDGATAFAFSLSLFSSSLSTSVLMMSLHHHIIFLSSYRLTSPSVAIWVVKIKARVFGELAFGCVGAPGASVAQLERRQLAEHAPDSSTHSFRACHAKRTRGFQSSRSEGHATHLKGSGTTRASGEGGTRNGALSQG